MSISIDPRQGFEEDRSKVKPVAGTGKPGKNKSRLAMGSGSSLYDLTATRQGSIFEFYLADNITELSIYVAPPRPIVSIPLDLTGAADNEVLASGDMSNFSSITVNTVSGAAVDHSYSYDGGTTMVTGQDAAAIGSAVAHTVITNYNEIVQAAAGTVVAQALGTLRPNNNVHGMLALDAFDDATAAFLLQNHDDSDLENGFLPIPVGVITRIPLRVALTGGQYGGGRIDVRSSDLLVPLDVWVTGS